MPTPSVEKSIRSRLLPRVSFRSILAAVTLTVFLAWLVRLVLQGQPWALAMLFPVIAVGIYFAGSFLLFLIAWVPAVAIAARQPDLREGNPFAADQMPPQILPPKGS